jgi:hypothetical protein
MNYFIRHKNLTASYLTPEINSEPENENGRDSRYNQQFDGIHRRGLSFKYIAQTTAAGSGGLPIYSTFIKSSAIPPRVYMPQSLTWRPDFD